VRDLLVERVGPHVLFEFALLALDCWGRAGGWEYVAYPSVDISTRCSGSVRAMIVYVEGARDMGRGQGKGNSIRSIRSSLCGRFSSPFFRLSVARWRSSS
jgi:hypothetical protein